jgi:hypothetical protein
MSRDIARADGLRFRMTQICQGGRGRSGRLVRVESMTTLSEVAIDAASYPQRIRRPFAERDKWDLHIRLPMPKLLGYCPFRRAAS